MGNATGSRFDKPGAVPPLRQSPFMADDQDDERAAFITHLWTAQDELRRPLERQIEENIRMLHGQHWIQWSEMRQRFVNLLDTMTDEEKRWRHMPVLNRLFLWFVLVHARMTENPPVISWQPGPDRIDALLAEVCDPIFKYVWRDTQMIEVLDRLIAWMIPSGRAYLKSRIDPTKGDPIPMSGPALLQLLNPQGSPILGPNGQPIQRMAQDVPFGRPQQPQGADDAGAEGAESDEYVPTMNAVAQDYDDDSDVDPDPDAQDYDLTPRPGVNAPELLYEGGIEVDVLTGLEVRGEWGQHVPWHKKAWHMQKALLTPVQAFEAFGVECEPDVAGKDAEGTAAFIRLLQGAGLFGAADSRRLDPSANQAFCTIYEAWFRPGRLKGTERTKQSPGGRLCIVTGSGKVLRDGVRPARFRYTSPIRAFDFVGLPGRPQGSSPQEFMNGPIRTRNRLFAQKLAVATLQANPIRVEDQSIGIEEGQITNAPGQSVLVDRSKSSAPPVEYVFPPALGKDVDEAANQLRQETDQMGQISGSEATPPTDDSSGELVKELRFNADRPIAATMKRMVIEIGRLGEDWLALAPIVYDKEKVIAIVGEDDISRTITVYPELFEDGTVNVEPEVESMLPEGRGERQERAWKFWKEGVWGDPRSPQATAQFLDQARFPHMARMTRPGGADRATAEQNVGKLLQGARAADLPMFPWYDHAMHLYVLELFMKAPEYLKLPPERQNEFVAFWQKVLAAQQGTMLLNQARALATTTAATADSLTAQASLQPLAAAAAPAGPPTPAGGAGAAGAGQAGAATAAVA